MAKLWKAFESGNTDLALRVHNILLPFVDVLFIEPNPAPLKAVFEHMGICQNQFRAPLMSVLDHDRKIILDCYEETQKFLL